MKVFNIVAGLASIIGLVITIGSVDWDSFSFRRNWLQLFIILFIIGFMVFLIINMRKNKKIRKGLDKLMSLRNIVDRVKNECTNNDYAFCQRKMYNLSSKISEIFKLLKDTEIAVCIKIINRIDGTEYIKTVARDCISLYERENLDNGRDKLEDNSDFCYLIEQHEGHRWNEVYFLANNLPHLYGYSNSHLNERNLSNGLKGFFIRHFQWNLPYKSTLIVAIAKPETDDLFAFLCIDSKKSFCFKEKDIEYIKNVAHTISDIVGITISKSQIGISETDG